MILSKNNSLLSSGSFLLLFLIVHTTICGQTVELAVPDKPALIPGQIVAYLPDDATPEFTQQLEDLDLNILKTDIRPVYAFIYTPDESALSTIKQHPSVTEMERHTFTYDSTTLKNLKFADGMTEEEKEQARKRFLDSEDRVTAFVMFDYDVTWDQAEKICAAVNGLGEYKIDSSPRMVYIQVEEGSESEQMDRLESLPFITKVARVAESEYVN